MIPALLSTACVVFAVFLATRSFGAVWDALSERFAADLTPMLQSLSISQSGRRHYFRLWGMSLVATFLLFGIYLRMLPVSVALTWLMWSVPRQLLHFLIRQRRERLRDQMVTASTALANTSRAGLSLAEGLKVVGDELPAPLGTEFQQISRAYEHGRPLPDAIRATSRRLDVDSFSLFAMALLTSLERGGRITQALERISRSLTEMQRVERKIEADTASGRKVVWLLTAFPFLFLAFSHYANRRGTEDLMNTTVGQLVLFVVIAMTWISFRWSQRIMEIEV